MIPKNVEKLEKEYFARASQYILAAFGLVAGLAWNDAIKALIDYLFPQDKSTLWAKFIYAVLITALVVIITKYVSGIISKAQEAEKSSRQKEK